MRTLGQKGKGRIITHTENWLLPILRHRFDHHFHIFEGITKGGLVGEYLLIIKGAVDKGLGFQMLAVLLNPFAIGMRLSHALFDFPVVQNFIGLQINGDRLSRSKATFFDDFCIRDIDRTCFRADDDHAIIGDHVTGRT